MSQKTTKQDRAAASNGPETKQFSLKKTELHMVQALESNYFANVSNFLSFIAIERLGQPVTSNTRFEIKDGKLYMTESIEASQPDPDEIEAA